MNQKLTGPRPVYPKVDKTDALSNIIYYPNGDVIKNGKMIESSSLDNDGILLDKPKLTKLKENKMTNTNKSKGNLLGSLGLEFGKYLGDQLAFSPAGIAVRKKDGDYVVYDKPNKQLISIGELKMDFPFYKLPIIYDKIEIGDLLQIDGSFFIVEDKTPNKGLQCISPVTGDVTNKPAKNNLYGMYFYTKIVSLLDSLGAGAEQTSNPMGSINPLMLMMLSKGEGNTGGNDMMQMLLMSQMLGGANQGMTGINPLMLMAMCGGDGNDDMMQMLLLSQLGGGISPMNLFGQTAAEPTGKDSKKK